MVRGPVFTLPKELLAEDDYYFKIEKAVQNSSEIDMKNIFPFDWDRIYFTSSPRFSGTEAVRKLGVKSDEDLYDIDVTNGDPSHYPVWRVIFVRKDKVVYDFPYDIRYLKFKQVDIFVQKADSIFKVESKGKPMILNCNNL